MGKLVLRAAALTFSIGVFALLLVHANRGADPPVTPVAAVDASVPPDTAVARPAAKRVYQLRGPATKADPHLAKMLAEEAAAGAGVIGILAEPSPKP